MRLITPDYVAYIWVKYKGGDTRILHNKKNVFYLEPSKVFKISLWKQDKDIFRNVGVFIGHQTCGGVNSHVAVWCDVQSEILFSLPVASLYEPLKKECDHALLFDSRPKLSRAACWHSELPFPITGRWGFPQINRPEPGWEDIWETAVKYAIKRIGFLAPETIKSIAQLALGFYGYTNLYYPEEVDDICGQFESLGTGNDCDDAAVCVAGIAVAIMNSNLCDPVATYIKKTWNMVFVTAGWAKPPGQTVLEGHMWVELFKLENGKCFKRTVVEATAPHPVLKKMHTTLNSERIGIDKPEVSSDYQASLNFALNGAHNITSIPEPGLLSDYRASFRWTHDTQYDSEMKVMQSPISYPRLLRELEFRPTIPDGWAPPTLKPEAGDVDVEFNSGVEIMPYRGVGIKIRKLGVVDYTS